MKKRVFSLMLSIVMTLISIPANVATKEVKVEAASAGRRVVGYFPSYRMYTIDSIDFSALTHCMLSFMTYRNGTLTSGFAAGDVQNIVSRCHANGVKAMIAIGGWGGFDASDNPFGTAQKRTSFVNQVMDYVTTYNLDGVDIDIELTDANIWNNFDALIAELSGRLKAEGKLLTMAVATWFTGSISNSTYQYFDFLNLMSYDYNQSGTGEVAPWSQIYDMVSYYGSRGVSNDKMVIGVPFYGYGTDGAHTYAEMINISAANANLDYANGVYYNGMSTIRQKAEYSKSYGGTMIWEIGQDSYGTYSLLNVIKEVMKNGNTETTTVAQETTTVQEVTTQAVSDGYTTANGDWNNLPYWSVYFAPNWGGLPTGEYKAGDSYNDFSVKVNTASGVDWEIQMKTQVMSVESGKTYICKVNVNSNVSTTNQIRFKEEYSQIETLKVLNAGSNTFELQFTASDSAQIFFDLGKAPAGLEFTVTSFSLEKVEEETEAPTEEPTTEEPTTEEPTTVVNTNTKLEINGCQVSTTVEGYRIVYSLSDTDSEVASVGMVYGLDCYATESEMVVGSTNSTVYTVEATDAGKLGTAISSMIGAQSYVMTMKFVKTAEFFNQKINVRAYAKLKTGEYVYSDIDQYVMYNVADFLYKNQYMNNMSGHNYLYNEILSLVDPTYEFVKYNMNNSLAKF